jgi:hypothetical protein
MKTFILTFFTIICVTIFLQAQNRQDDIVLSSQGVEMMPYKTGSCTSITFYDKDFTNTLPKHTLALYEEKFNQLISVFKQNPVLEPPIGFEARIEKRIECITKVSIPEFFFPADSPVTSASAEIHFSPYYSENGKPTVNFKVSSFFQIHFNNPYVLAGTPVMADIYTCPRKVESFHSHGIYATNREEVTIINFSGKQLFLPVSQEDFIQVLIAYWLQKIDEDKTAQENYIANTATRLNAAEKQRQKQEFEHAYNELLKYDKTAADDLKKTYEEIMGINFNENNDAVVFDSAISFAQSQINRLREELQTMSPAQKNRQGIYYADAFELFNNASGLVPESHKSMGDALVRINPDLVKEFPEKIQLLSIHWYLLHENYDKPRTCQISNDAGFITDNKLLLIYSDGDFWRKLFQTLNK